MGIVGGSFFFNDTATTEIYTLSLHDALPIFTEHFGNPASITHQHGRKASSAVEEDRKSTRLNSSHSQISYAVFCLKKKKATPRLSPFPPNIPALAQSSQSW